MRTFFRILSIAFFSIGGLALQEANSQSVLDPNDPVINYNPSSPPTQPPAGQIGKWVRTPRNFGWNTDVYKSYIYNGYAFRLKFPKTYNPTANDGKKYPMIVFFHGYGEIDTTTDNEFHLLHGASMFAGAVENGTFDGYVLFMQSQSFFHNGHYQAIVDIINYMITNNKLDPFDIVLNGLSSGGEGVWEMARSFPTYLSAGLPMSWAKSEYSQSATVNLLRSMPMWLFQGGVDYNPYPSTSYQVRDSFLANGGNFRLKVYPNIGHDTWYYAWNEEDFWPFVNAAYSSNPWPLSDIRDFFPGETINTTLSLVPGYSAYEWRRDSVLIPGANSHLLNVTQTGTYQARVQRNGIWSEWSRIPVIVKIKDFTTIPAKIEAENFAKHEGVKTEWTQDVGGGFNVGWIDLDDWMSFHLYVPQAGTYPVRFRIASAVSNAQFQLRNASGTALATINVPNTGTFQSWQTIQTSVFLPAGYQTIRLYSTAAPRWNINWFEFLQSNSAPLPVNFVSIDARKEGNGARVTWKVSDEINVVNYVIEKSTDRSTFTSIGTVNATRATQYQFVDPQVLARNYYRVKSVDANGAFKYSSIVNLSGGRSAIVFQAFPLPAKDKITVQHSTTRSNAIISVVALDGKVVKTVIPNRNAQQTTIDLSSVAAGVYMLRYDDGTGEVETLKFVKQ